MKRIGTNQYLEGIYSLVNFTELLGQVIREIMPGIRLKKVSAFAWRGYQIVHYPGLSDGHYFCQVNFDDPNFLKFEEYFEMVNYPFLTGVNLNDNGYF